VERVAPRIAFFSDREQSRAKLDEHQELERLKDELGSNSLQVGLTLTGDDRRPMMFLHPQLLSDWALVLELLTTFDAAMREHYGMPAALDQSSVWYHLREDDCPFLKT
jgi:hypothetical protein